MNTFWPTSDLPEPQKVSYIKKEEAYLPVANIWSVRTSGISKQDFITYLHNRVDKWQYLGLKPEVVNVGSFFVGNGKRGPDYAAFVKLIHGADLGLCLPSSFGW